MSEGVKMTERAPGTFKNTGLALMAIGVVCLLLVTVLSLRGATTAVAQASGVLLIAGIAALAAGGVFYVLARSKP